MHVTSHKLKAPNAGNFSVHITLLQKMTQEYDKSRFFALGEKRKLIQAV